MRAKRSLLLLAVVGVAVWLLLSSGPGGGFGIGGRTLDGESRDTMEGAEGPARTADPGKAETSRYRPTAPPPPEDEPASVELDLPDPDGVLIRVVDKQTGAPIPLAYVAMETEDGGIGHRLRRSLMGIRSLVDFAVRHGRTYRCDEQGEVRVAWSSESAGVTAWKGARAERVYRMRVLDGAVTIELGPPKTLHVIVLDAGGAPAASVPIALRQSHQGGMRAPIAHALTDPEGRARFDHVGLISGSGDSGFDTVVGLDVPLEQPIEKTVALNRLTDAPVELRLPATGSVRVRVSRQPGHEAPLSVALGPHRNPEHRRMPIPAEGTSYRPLGTNDEVVFPHVGLGVSLDLEIWAGIDGTPVYRSIDALGRANEAVTVDVPWQDPTARITGVARLPDGAPLGRRLISVRLGDDQRTLRADADGRFSFNLDDVASGDARTLVLRTRDADPRRATVTLPAQLRPTLHDLGDVVMAPELVIVAGRVEDPSGHPLPAATVRLERGSEESPGEIEWAPVPGSVATDRQGRFTFPVPPAVEGSGQDLALSPWRVRVTATGFATKRQEAPYGARGIVVRVARGARCTARFLLPEDVTTDDIDLRLMPDSARFGVAPAAVQAASDGSATVLFENLAPGRHTLEVRLDSLPAITVHRLPDIHVPSRGDVEDPRLLPLDLRPTLRCCELTVVDPFGKAVEAEARLTRDGERSRWVKLRTLRPPRRVVFPADATLDVGANGLRVTRVPSPRRRERVVLPASSRVVLRVAGVQLPPQTELTAWFSDPSRFRSDHLRFDSGGLSEIASAETLGAHRVTLTLDMPGSTPRRRRLKTVLEVVVEDVPGIQEFSLTLPQSDIDEAASR